MPKCILLVVCEICPTVEDEWNTWYDEVHLPAALACPGVICGARYKSEGALLWTEQGRREVRDTVTYATIYEVEGPEVLETPEFRAMAGWYQFKEHISARTQILRQL
ncbi:MAG: hypothetical protein KDC18_03200 [Alphaproteobacteria bacterium]|nr:hypothetical protein [Alphaproteobacteria bacterium]MCB9929941.1 hypothetical protein [Alphaproteobacteria bacterium]